MAEDTNQRANPTEPRTDDSLERAKQDALKALLGESLRFVRIDNDINESLKELLGALVGEIKRDPRTAFTRQGDINALVSALKTNSEGDTGVSGGDIVGADVIDDIKEIIEVLGKPVRDEKDFFSQNYRADFLRMQLLVPLPML